MRRASTGVITSDEITRLTDLLNEVPINEIQRLMIIKETGILEVKNEEKYDRLISVACRSFKAACAWLSIVDVNRICFKSKMGKLQRNECPRSRSPCDYVVLEESPEIVVIYDMLQDARFKDYSLVQEEPKIRFYAASPIIVGGIKIGAVSIADTKPRIQFGKRERMVLVELAEIISEVISEERSKIMDTEKDLAYVTSSVLNIIKHPLKKAVVLLPRSRQSYIKLVETYDLKNHTGSSVASTTTVKSKAIEEFKHSVIELQKEIQTLQELLQISLKSIMRIFRIGNYLQQNKHHHYHYFNPNKVFSFNSGANGSYHSYTSRNNNINTINNNNNNAQESAVSRSNSPTAIISNPNDDSYVKPPSQATSTPSSSTLRRNFTMKTSSNYHNNNMILWNSDDNLSKLHAIVDKYRSHCTLTCFQHEFYLLNKEKHRLFTHSDIILLMLILILNYAKSTDHRCEIGILLQMSGIVEREFAAVKKYGTIQIDVKLIDLIGPSRVATTTTSTVTTAVTGTKKMAPMCLSPQESDKNADFEVPISNANKGVFSMDDQDESTVATDDYFSKLSRASSTRHSHGNSYREIEDSDQNMLLTALNLVHWISGEVKEDSVELPNAKNNFQLITHCVINIPCFEKYMVDETSEENEINSNTNTNHVPSEFNAKDVSSASWRSGVTWSHSWRQIFQRCVRFFPCSPQFDGMSGLNPENSYLLPPIDDADSSGKIRLKPKTAALESNVELTSKTKPASSPTPLSRTLSPSLVRSRHFTKVSAENK